MSFKVISDQSDKKCSFSFEKTDTAFSAFIRKHVSTYTIYVQVDCTPIYFLARLANFSRLFSRVDGK